MKMLIKRKIITLLVVVFCCISITLAQEKITESINGTYYLFEKERGVDTKVFQYGEHNGVKLLAIAPCAKCMPAVYTYLGEKSKELKTPVFKNKVGLFVVKYDNESFVMVMPTDNAWSAFAFSNFYSKNKVKIQKINKEKIKDFIEEIHNK